MIRSRWGPADGPGRSGGRPPERPGPTDLYLSQVAENSAGVRYPRELCGCSVLDSPLQSAPNARACGSLSNSSRSRNSSRTLLWEGVIAPVPRIMRLFWAFSLSNPPESPSQEESSLANMPDTLEARCRSDGPPAGPRSIDPLPGSRSFLTVSAVA